MCFKLKRQLFPVSNRTVDYIGGAALWNPRKDLLLLSSNFTMLDLYNLSCKMGPRNCRRIKRLVKESSSFSEMDRWSGETDNGAPVTNFVEGSHKMFTWLPNLEHITIILERHSPPTQAQKNSNGKLGLIDCTSSDESEGWWMRWRHQQIIKNYQMAWSDHVRRLENKTDVPFPEDRSLTVDFKQLVVVE
jgi:hypothetical protein